MTDPATAWLVIALAFLLTLGILAIACAVTADDLPAPPDPDDWWHDGRRLDRAAPRPRHARRERRRVRLWIRRARRPATNEERLKRQYVTGKMTLTEFTERIDTQLRAGTLDDVPIVGRSPSDVAARWAASVSGASPSWADARARDTLTGSSDE